MKGKTVMRKSPVARDRKPPVTKRSATPKYRRDDNGNAIMLCPFCDPPHPINPESPATCGTMLVLTAEQVVIHAKYAKDIVCFKCHQGGGDMVPFQGAYIHAHNCSPGVVAFAQPPEYSNFAKLIYNTPEWLSWPKKIVTRIFGDAVPVQEITPEGEKTGVILGYIFNKE